MDAYEQVQIVAGTFRAADVAFRRDLIRWAASIGALATTVPPNSARNPAQGRSSKALPPGRPMKKPYNAQMIASTAGWLTAIACDTGEAA
jgi:hypothetical protein